MVAASAPTPAPAHQPTPAPAPAPEPVKPDMLPPPVPSAGPTTPQDAPPPVPTPTHDPVAPALESCFVVVQPRPDLPGLPAFNAQGEEAPAAEAPAAEAPAAEVPVEAPAAVNADADAGQDLPPAPEEPLQSDGFVEAPVPDSQVEAAPEQAVGQVFGEADQPGTFVIVQPRPALEGLEPFPPAAGEEVAAASLPGMVSEGDIGGGDGGGGGGGGDAEPTPPSWVKSAATAMHGPPGMTGPNGEIFQYVVDGPMSVSAAEVEAPAGEGGEEGGGGGGGGGDEGTAHHVPPPWVKSAATAMHGPPGMTGPNGEIYQYVVDGPMSVPAADLELPEGEAAAAEGGEEAGDEEEKE
jgi:hypothetical protein